MKKSICALLLLLTVPASAGGFENWAAVVAAGDSYSEDQKDTQVFDNGRLAIVKRLQAMGFKAGNIRQYTDWPEHYPGVEPTSPKRIAKGLSEAAVKANAGCLVYLTSHGSSDGVSAGDYVLGPRTLKKMIGAACQKRPAVIVVSACYSGVFVPYLKAADRIVLTAAAKDRSSFGCGATDQYTYFDACVIETLPKTHDAASFGQRTIACVAAREKKEQVDQPSNPQLVVGDKTAGLIPHW